MPHTSLGLAWAGIFVPCSLALIAIAVPFLLTHGFPLIALALRRGFALVCHQRPERSLLLFGGYAAVCARCLGIYFGAAIGSITRVPRRQTALALLGCAASLNLLDWATELAGLHGNWRDVRFVLGMTLGAAGSVLIRSAARSMESLKDCTTVTQEVSPGSCQQPEFLTSLR